MPKTNVSIAAANVPQLAIPARSSRKRLIVQNLSSARVAFDDDPSVSTDPTSSNVGLILGPWDGISTPPSVVLDDANNGSLAGAYYVVSSMVGARILFRESN